MPPNIIFILMDDLGWRDIGASGSTFYETPNLDRLAAEGMRFTNAYAACPVCSPTRASCMTGRYPARVGITDWIAWNGMHPCKGKLIDAPYVASLPDTETTVASALRDGGYRTWHVGKWHLSEPGVCPTQYGFDVNVGGCEWGAPLNGYFSPWGIPGLEDAPDGTYLPDHLTDRVIELIQGSDGPFFLNLWYYLVHIPIQAKQEHVTYFQQKAIDMGLDKVDTFAEGDYFPCEHRKTRRITRRLVQSDPVYAGMVKSMDENIGRILDVLQAAGLADDTLVVFTSDNGGASTSDGSPTCNLPLAEGKGWMYEGGTREPLIVRWPGKVPAGSICETPVSSPDFYPTFLEAAGFPLRPEQHADGVSLMPLLLDEGELSRDAIFWHYPHYGNQGGTPGASIRCGDHKLIRFFEDDRLELYNLRDDEGEQNNLAGVLPELAAALNARLQDWQDEIEAVLPQRNPDFVPWSEAHEMETPFVDA